MSINSYVLAMLLLLSFACRNNSVESNNSTAATATAVVVKDTVPTDPFADLPYVVTEAFNLDYLRGRFNPAKHPDFTAVPAELTDRDGTYYLRKDATAAFARMATAAKAAGVSLKIISATRNFNRQKSIWEAKWNGQRLLEGKEKAPEAYPDPADRARAILRWSSMPGTSRHHWGTDIDINDLNNGYFSEGRGLKEYQWLEANARTYGFCQPYSPKGDERPNGYNEEKWHWSYLPVALPLTQLAADSLRNEDIGGFEGAEAAAHITVVDHYVLGINTACKHR